MALTGGGLRAAAWNIADVFEWVADAVPEAEAVVAGERRLTFAGLDERANRLAAHLEAGGIGPGDRVGVNLHNSAEYLEATLAAFKLRAVPVNVNYRYTGDELAYLLDDADADAIVFHTSVAGPVLDAAARLPRLRTFLAVADGPAAGDVGAAGVVAYEDALAGAPAGRPDPTDRSADDLYLLYTGGTTGRPKGVMWRHEDVLRAGLLGPESAGMARPEAVAARARRGGRRGLPAVPLMHGTGQWAALSTLLGGGTVVLSPDRRFDPGQFWSLVAAERVSFIAVVGDAVARPLVDVLDDARRRLDLSCVRHLLSSGAILSPAVKEALARHLPGVLVVDTYGSSESGPQARAVGAGDTRFRADKHTVVLGDDLRPVAPGSGVVGRVARSGHIALGYWKDPQKTAETFPVVDGVRHVITGDYARLEADGSITLLGRGSACINTGGEKVFPEEVEAVLKSHPGVYDALVVGVPDERFGERVVAVVQPRAGAEPRPGDLEAHSRRGLAGFKIPRAVVFAGEIRRTASGKADYRWARQHAVRELAQAAGG